LQAMPPSTPSTRPRPRPTIDSVLASEPPKTLKATTVDLPYATNSKWALCHTCFTVDDLLSAEECEELIRITEEHGYEAAQINVGGGRQRRMDDFRKSGRCIIDSEMFASKLWERLAPLLADDGRSDTASRGWVPIELNERFRFLRYSPGDYFKPHQDGSYVRESGAKKGDRSFQTVMVYLNDASRGGETKFLNPGNDREAAVVPRRGLGLCFDHDLHHEGARLDAGHKYAIRTDVMFRPIHVVAAQRAAAAPSPAAAEEAVQLDMPGGGAPSPGAPGPAASEEPADLPRTQTHRLDLATLALRSRAGPPAERE